MNNFQKSLRVLVFPQLAKPSARDPTIANGHIRLGILANGCYKTIASSIRNNHAPRRMGDFGPDFDECFTIETSLTGPNSRSDTCRLRQTYEAS
jgi:hypothetical protein